MTLEQLLALLEQAEGDLSALSVEELGALRDALYAGYQEFRPTADSDEAVDALTRVAAAIAAVDLVLADSGVESDGGDDEGDGEGDEGDTDAVQQRLTDLDALVQARDPEDIPPVVGGPSGSTDGVSHPVGEAPLPAPVEDAPVEDKPAKSKAKSARTRRPTIDALRAASDNVGVATAAVRPNRILAAAGADPNLVPGAELSLEQLGMAVQRAHRGMQTLQTVDQLDPDSVIQRADGTFSGQGGRRQYIGTVDIVDRAGIVQQTDASGPEIIDQAVREWIKERDRLDQINERMVASGGNCVMALPDYSINVVGARGTCFTDNLPTVSGPRPMAYYPWLEINQATGATGPGSNVIALQGMGFVTEEQDRLGYGDPTITPAPATPGSIPTGGSAYKSCVHIDCPATPLLCDLEAVYKCVTIGNFQAQSHPEYVDAFNTYMDIHFDIERDNRALDKFVAHATANSHVLQVDDKVFGAVSSIKDVFNRFVAHERSSHHDNSLNFNVVSPDWFGGFLALDLMRHTFGTVENLRATPSQAMSLASTDGIRLSTYCTQPGITGSGAQDMVLPPISTAVPAWPTRVRLLVYPDGAVFKKTGASLSFGLRETLMKTNDFGMFMELMENVCFRTGRVWVLDLKLCANGATGAPVALTCA